MYLCTCVGYLGDTYLFWHRWQPFTSAAQSRPKAGPSRRRRRHCHHSCILNSSQPLPNPIHRLTFTQPLTHLLAANPTHHVLFTHLLACLCPPPEQRRGQPLLPSPSPSLGQPVAASHVEALPLPGHIMNLSNCQAPSSTQCHTGISPMSRAAWMTEPLTPPSPVP